MVCAAVGRRFLCTTSTTTVDSSSSQSTPQSTPQQPASLERALEEKQRRRKRKLQAVLLISLSAFLGAYVFTSYWDHSLQKKKLKAEQSVVSPPYSVRHSLIGDQVDGVSALLQTTVDACESLCNVSSKWLTIIAMADHAPAFLKTTSLFLLKKYARIEEFADGVVSRSHQTDELQAIGRRANSNLESKDAKYFYSLAASLSLQNKGVELLSEAEWLTIMFESQTQHNITPEVNLLRLFTLYNILAKKSSSLSAAELEPLVIYVTSNGTRDEKCTRQITSILLHLAKEKVEVLNDKRVFEQLFDIVNNQLESRQDVTSILHDAILTMTLLTKTNYGKKVLVEDEEWVKVLTKLTVSSDFHLRSLIASILSNLLDEKEVKDVFEGMDQLFRRIHQKDTVKITNDLPSEFVLNE